MSAELRGPAGVRADLVAFYRAWLPRHIGACRTAWGLSADELPAPASVPDDGRADAYFAAEPPVIDRWPMLTINTGRRTQRAVDRTDNGDLEYRSIYPVRVYLWVKAEGRDGAQTMRDNLATAAQITTLSHLNLDGDGTYAVVPTTVVTDFSRVEPVKGDRFVAGAFVGFDLQAVETLTDRLAAPGEQPRDTVSTVTTEATALPYELDVTP